MFSAITTFRRTSDPGSPVTIAAIARAFLRARANKVGLLLTTLADIGQTREVDPGSQIG